MQSVWSSLTASVVGILLVTNSTSGEEITPATATRTALDRQNWQECFPRLSDRLEAMRANKELLAKEDVNDFIRNPRGLEGQIQTSPQGSIALSPMDIAARLKKSKLYIGWYFKCNHCDNWHLNFGAGFPVAKDGFVVTCYHVLALASEQMREGHLVAVDGDGRIHRVEQVVAVDEKADCALLKIEGATDLPPLPLNIAPKVGEEAFVLSNPMGLSDYFSSGMINRTFVDSPSQELTEDESNRRLRLNIGAEWAPGSSGAPIVDKFGNLLGFVCAARQMMGPAGQPVQADGKPIPDAVSGVTTLLTIHEAGTAIAVKMLLESAKR